MVFFFVRINVIVILNGLNVVVVGRGY
jgi:hypothetical protein